MPIRAAHLAVAFALALSALPAGCGDGGTGGDRDGSMRDARVLRLDGGDEDPDARVIVRLDGGDRADAGPPAECPPPPECDAPLPGLGSTEEWRHAFASAFTAGSGAPRHRGRDLYLRESDPQWALAKFAYGASDDDLQDEDVDIHLLRGCEGAWEMLGTAATTNDGDHGTIEGVIDTGGRIYFEIPASARLSIGRHRIAFVVRGDHTIATQLIEVLPDGARFVVTDVDGTQTSSETAEWGAVFGGASPTARASGPELMWAFAARGHHVFYLTARPDWLSARTHEWLEERGYPPGIVHTTLGSTGATGAAAQSFKTGELLSLLERFPDAIEYAIGNTDTDTAAYAGAGIPPERSFLYMYDPGPDGTRVDDYATLIPVIDALAASCL